MSLNHNFVFQSLVNELVNQLNLGRNEVNKGYGYLTLVNSDFYKAIGQGMNSNSCV